MGVVCVSCADFALAVPLAYPLDLRSIRGLWRRPTLWPGVPYSARERGVPGWLRPAHGDWLLVTRSRVIFTQGHVYGSVRGALGTAGQSEGRPTFTLAQGLV